MKNELRGFGLVLWLSVLGCSVLGCSSPDLADDPRPQPFTIEPQPAMARVAAETPEAHPAAARVDIEEPVTPIVTTTREKTPLATRLPSSGASEFRDLRMIFPGADASSGVIQIDRRHPANVLVGEAFRFEIAVSNLLDQPVDDVRVHECFPVHFKLDAADPPFESSEPGVVTWALGQLGPRQTRVITVTATPERVLDSESCTWVDYALRLYTTAQVVKPSLQLTTWLPETLRLCDEIPARFVVTNLGTGLARDVQVVSELPEHLDSESPPTQSIQFRVDALLPGESKEFAATLRSGAVGIFKCDATARASNSSEVNAETVAIRITEPMLEISHLAPGRIHLGRTFEHEVTLTNRGDAPANSSVVQWAILPGSAVVEVSPPASAWTESTISWELGSISIGGHRKISITYRAEEAGVGLSRVQASAECATPVIEELMTELWVTSLLNLSVSDREVPTAVGEREVYRIRVKNRGTAADTNIQVRCTLEEGMQYVYTSGTTAGIMVHDNEVSLPPIAFLDPGEEKEWLVTVKAQQAGHMRFKAELTSDQLEQPLETTVVARYYE